MFDMITGLLRPDSGNIVFGGVDITKKDPHEIANLGISRTFQQVRLFHYLSILDHLRMTDDNDDVKLWKNVFSRSVVARKEYEQLLEEYGIERGLDTPVSELSYGQRKLLNIAMGVRKPHQLLLLDEPVAGVNSVVQDRVEHILLALKEQGETMLLIDHDMGFVRRLADYVIAIDAGVVIAEGTPEEVLMNKDVLEAYLGE